MGCTINGVHKVLCLALLILLAAGCSGGGGGGGFTGGSGEDADIGGLAVTAAPTEAVANNATVAITATVTDTAGDPLSGVEVTFATTLGALEATTATTNADGVAQTALRTGTQAGSARVTATAGNFSADAVVTIAADVPAAVTVALSDADGRVDPGAAVAVQATVTDANANPVVGETVAFSIITNASGGSLDMITADTDANGQATVTYTAGGNAGEDVVQARTTSNSVTGTVTVTVDAPPSAAASLQLLTSSPQLNSSGTEPVTLTAVVRNASNVVVEGVEVTFSADNDGSLQIVRGTTDASGTAVAMLSTAGNPENRTITATAEAAGITDMVTVQVVGTSIAIAGPNSAVLGDSIPLSLTLRNSANMGIAGQTLTVTSELGNEIGDANPVTGPNGQATITVMAAVGGDDTITVSGAGAMATLALAVSTDSFGFVDPVPETIDLNDTATLTVSLVR
nr:Ig-like domain-containing protein [Pseudomonadota bacterium]